MNWLAAWRILCSDSLMVSLTWCSIISVKSCLALVQLLSKVSRMGISFQI